MASQTWWNAYKAILHSQPLATKATTAAILMAISDVLTQAVEQKQSIGTREWSRSNQGDNSKSRGRTILRRNNESSGPAPKTGLPVVAVSPSMTLVKRTAISLHHASHKGSEPSSAIASQSPTSIISSHWDISRTLQVALTGGMLSGPLSHVWYDILDRIQNGIHQQPNCGATTSGRRASSLRLLPLSLILDALVFSPVAIAGYLLFRTLLKESCWPAADLQIVGCKDSYTTTTCTPMQSYDPEKVVLPRRLDAIPSASRMERMDHQLFYQLQPLWWSTLQASWSFWPVANIVNFSLVPLPYRVLYNNGLSLLWNGYLSNSFSKAPQPLSPEDEG